QASAQAAGSISMADVVGFTFHAPDTNYNYPFLSLSPDPVPISTLTAGFTSSSSEIISGNALATITLPIDSNYDIIGGEHWSSSGYDGQYSGVGHWIITGAAAVPEPSTAILLGLGLAIVTGARVVRVRAPRVP
ncbi:MAG: PEP-CTERM sorting domain-containing protein, partial [Mycobacterium sp.]